MALCAECHRQIEDGSRFCPYCGTALPAPAQASEDPFLGAVVNGKYRVEALVGRGGMGRVYRARHLTLDRVVALKMLHRAYSGDPQIVMRFQREARAASRLDHPNSIAVLDFGEAEDGTLFMVMEYLDGKDLGRVLVEEFPLREKRIVGMGTQVLSALSEAHAKGIIHRDLKPENVMVVPRRDNPDFVKVLDFGIAKIVSAAPGEPRLTQAGLVCGTPEYMSPEQARGADLDARSDLYSMGVLLYQLATGSLPFESDTPVGFLTAHLSSPPVPPRQRRPDLSISPALDALISRALMKEPERRFQSAEEMRSALFACLPKAALGSRLPKEISRGPAFPTGRTSRRPFWAFVAVMGVALVAGFAMVVLVKRTSADRRHFARDPEAKLEPSAARVPPFVAESAPGAAPALPGPVPLTPGKAPDLAKEVAEEPQRPAARRSPSLAPGDAALRAAGLFKQAEGLRARQEVDGAIPLYLLALKEDPGLSEAHKKLALCYQLKGDKKHAVEQYRRYLLTSPRDADRVRAILGTLE